MALDSFRVCFMARVDDRPPKVRVRVRVRLGTNFMAYNIIHTSED